MKITYLKVENTKAVMSGMGKRKIELDFSKSKNQKILILGDNGSGKSVLMSMLSPYRGTNDVRSVEPLEGCDAYKEIHYLKGDDKYIIKHYYGKSSSKNKSYILKNDEELNENGNIKSFNEVMEKELEISSDYFAVGRLGDNVKNFIDYPTAERKKYINKFIPNIDDYLTAYKKADEKLAALNKRLKTLNTQLLKYDDLDGIKKNLKHISSYVKESDEKKNSINLKIALMRKEIEDLEERKKNIRDSVEKNIKEISGGDQRVFDLESCNTVLNSSIEDLDKLYEKYPKLKDYSDDEMNHKIEELKISIPTNEGKISNLTTLLNEYTLNLDNVRNSINSDKERLKSYENRDNIDTLKEVLSEQESSLVSLEDSLSKLKSENEISEFISSITSIETVEKYIVVLNDIVKNVSYWKTDSEIDDELLKLTRNKLFDRMKSLDSEEEKLKAELEEVHSVRNSLTQESSLLKILDHSEHHEHTKDCPFVPMALDFKNDKYPTLTATDDKIKELEGKVSEVVKEFERINMHLKSYDDFNKLVQNPINENLELLTNLELADINLMKVQPVKYQLASHSLEVHKKILNTLTNIEVIKSKIDNTKSRMDMISEIDDNIKYLNEGITEKSGRLVSLNENVESTNSKIDELKKKITISKTTEIVMNKLKSLRSDIAKYGSLKEIIAESRKSIEGIEAEKAANVIDLSEMQKELISVEGMQKDLKANYEKLNETHAIVKVMTEEIEAINSVHNTIRTITTALDPKKGIPLIFIDSYLTNIAERANKLLSIAYDGQFFIKFNINEKEFKIVVAKGDGTELEDISIASQGETAMTNVSLSLAMLHNITKGYNVLYFDEVDATLDGNNRRNFLSVLQMQIDELNSEQAFIISHNNEFYSSDVDLILLNGYQSKVDIEDKVFMKNKTVIYKN